MDTSLSTNIRATVVPHHFQFVTKRIHNGRSLQRFHKYDKVKRIETQNI
ncbi:MAG: hypothetical protein LBH60_09835 [Prevotellaceae bacterium]|nr:hypothetical protein [Prevotellaceae bacterium]